MPPKQQQQQQQPKSDAALIAAIAGALVIGASAQATATTLSPVVGIPVPSLLPVLLIAMSKPTTYGIATMPSASASSEAQRLEGTYRAQYVLVASRRMRDGLRAGIPRETLLQRERTYFDQHIAAVARRRDTAAKVDAAAKRHGDLLGWYAVLDNRTSRECREAHGKNFNASVRPAIGYPGSVHLHCRCRPGKAHSTSKTVYSVKPEERAA